MKRREEIARRAELGTCALLEHTAMDLPTAKRAVFVVGILSEILDHVPGATDEEIAEAVRRVVSAADRAR